ncbi:MAG: hypothetical protein OEQ53_15620, partial [Saprospiraceae bacterium]|nr:hypothetical protein [Saprospiraceae bacterium]
EIKLISTIHPQGVPSNVARELLYNLEHLIHHLAIIRIAMREVEPDVELGAHFGVAPSTLLYRAEHKAHRN